MVSTCVDSALDELDELVRDSSLSIPMKRQIKNLQLELRFLKTFFWCLARCGDAVKDVLMESDIGGIEATLSRAGQGLHAAGSCAIDGVQTEGWDLISANLLKKVEQIKPQINRICLDLLDQSLQCTYSTSREIMEFIGAILKNLKDGLNHRPNMQKQIRDFEEMLDFLRNFVSVTKRGVIKYDKFQDFLNHVQTCANNAACVLFLYWTGDQMNEATAPRMSNILSDPLQKIKPFASDFTGMYLGVLKASEPASSDPVMTSEVVTRFADFLLQYLPASMKDYIPILGEGLMFLITFLVHPPSETKKGQHLFAEADAVLCNIASFICSLFVDRTNEGTSELRHSVLLDFLIRVDIIKVEVKELYVEIFDLSLSDFPKTNGVGFINFFVENLNEMLERKAFLKPFEKEKIAAIQKELVLLRCFLKDSFELRNEEMEMRILKATYKAEHVIDCVIHSPIWYRMICLSDVKEEIKNIKTDVKRMEDEHKYKIADKINISHFVPAQDKVSTFSHNADAAGPDDETIKVMDLPTEAKISGMDVVAFKSEACEISDQLTGGSKQLEIVSIVGEAGIGKTTLARKVFNSPPIRYHFDTCLWCHVSQEHYPRKSLLNILNSSAVRKNFSELCDDDLAFRLYMCLKLRRFLVVLDDVWDIMAWDDIKGSFPADGNGSRILLTTRILHVGLQASPAYRCHFLHPLSDEESWKLFEAKLFPNDVCPPELLEVGQRIAKNCRGLPSNVVLIARVLAKEGKNLHFWEQVARNPSSYIATEPHMDTLEYSYKGLRDVLKSCFLYFGNFQQETAIKVKKLIRLWSAEGIVQETEWKSLENVANEYLMDLVNRSLVIIDNKSSTGRIKHCRIDDLLHCLCLAKVEEERFLQLLNTSNLYSNGIKYKRYRLCIHSDWKPFVNSEPTGPNVRSLLFHPNNSSNEHPYAPDFFSGFQLLRVLDLEALRWGVLFPEELISLVHLRYLAVTGDFTSIPSSINSLMYLETLCLRSYDSIIVLPNTICYMKRLRHVDIPTGATISWDDYDVEKSIWLHNLVTFSLLYVSRREDAEMLFRMLPKVQRLRFQFYNQFPALDFLHNLESLNVHKVGRAPYTDAVQYPSTLRKLTVSNLRLPWHRMSAIAKLPNLQVLKLLSRSFEGPCWNINVDEFLSLKFLKLESLNITEWKTNDMSLPCLQQLVVKDCIKLEEIPYNLSEIPTLQILEVHGCSSSVADSARVIVEEHQDLGGASEVIVTQTEEEHRSYPHGDTLNKVVEVPTGKHEGKKIKGTLVLMKKNVLDFNNFSASVLDRLDEFLGKKVSVQLISSVNGDPEKGLKGKLGSPAYLENWISTITSSAAESAFDVTFDWDEEIGVPGALIIRNFHQNEFYLKTLTLEGGPGHERVHFVCNSWVYPVEKCKTDRIFFTNQAYLPNDTPEPLRKYREEELLSLRGDGTGELKEWDRVYDYAYYNDLGDPDKGSNYARPVLGGSLEYPYPRRGRTGRPPTKTDPNSEGRLPLLLSLNLYVPRDERFGSLKMSDFLAYGLCSVSQFLLPEFESLFDQMACEFDTFEDVLKIYEGGIKLPDGPLLKKITESIPFEFLKQLLPSDREALFKYPMPNVIEHDKSAWRTDEEFAREMLAGVNPMIISGLQEFPPLSKLDPKIYGNQTSTITREHIEEKLNGLTVDEAMEANRLFILNHHDTIMPHLRRINTTSTKTYASRTLLFLQDDGTLKPLAIELSLPHSAGDQFGAISKVYTPAEHGVEKSIWQLAKAYVAVNDSGVHHLITHWLRTHVVIEPFVIATNRQLSVLHPIYKLLHPHFRDTMSINAIGRQILINAGGVVEATLFPSKFAMEMSAVVYKDWVFPEQALPTDLIKRGVAVEDPGSPYGIRLLIQDYPFAVDGLKIWSAIKTWVEDYCNFYYRTDEMIHNDTELQSWWKEIREKGHGDKKDEPWWPKMHTCAELIESCTIIIWVSSALHASTNFGQWPYAGYHPNRPTTSRRFMPEPGTPEYDELKTNPDKVFLKTITGQLQTLLTLSIIEILSRHSSDEVYLGQRDNPDWTKDSGPLEAFQKFGKTLPEIEEQIIQMNNDKKWKNRVGPVNIPYTLLFPTSEEGITGKGIPNSIAI